jgi:DNA ligase (NAD+)
MTKIEAPSNCPSCDSVLNEVNHLLYCVNPHCGEKALKLIEHFAKTLKIKGLGPATIVKLDVLHLEELYALTLDDIAHALGSDRLAVKLVDELERSQSAPLNVLLPAFSIPLVGKTASEKLSKVCNDIEEIDYEICRKAGLGEKTAINLCNWIENSFLEVSLLPFSFKFENKVTPSVTAGVVCITGKLVSYKTKAEAHQVLQELGYAVKTSLTKDVTILVNESGIESAKTTKARDAGVTIVTNLKQFIGE